MHPAWYDAGPVRRGDDWPWYVAQPQTDVELVPCVAASPGAAPFIVPMKLAGRFGDTLRVA